MGARGEGAARVSERHDGRCALCKRHTKVATYRPTRAEAEQIVRDSTRGGTRVGISLVAAMRPVECCERCENGYARMLQATP